MTFSKIWVRLRGIAMNAAFRKFFLLLTAIISVISLPCVAIAAALIRDAEMEMTLRRYAEPIFAAAELSPNSVNIFIVNDESINAFVAGGSNIFIHTGLLMAATDPTMLIGVIAHETGHIAGGHLAQGSEQLQNATFGTILSYVLGAAAAIGGGAQAGSAIISAGQHITYRNMLSFTRMNEQAADQAALRYLDSINISAGGLLALMEKLRIKETVYKQNIDPYALTHPLSKERIAHIRGHILTNNTSITPISTTLQMLHSRLLAKLRGFLQPPETTLSQYPIYDNMPANKKLAARYARAIAYHKQTNIKLALQEIDNLLAQYPNDPYFLELKGQILAENNRHKEAVTYYKQAVALLPNVALLRTEYGKELLAQQPPQYSAALKELKLATLQDPLNATSWKLLGECYAAMQQKGQAALAYAEAALLQNKPQEAIQQAMQAINNLPDDSPAKLRAEDLQAEAIRIQKQTAEKDKTSGLSWQLANKSLYSH